MNIQINKRRGFTFVEVVLSIMIFSLIVIGFYTSMFGLYENTEKENKATVSLYEGQGKIENVSVSVKEAKDKVQSIADKIKDTEKKMKDETEILSNQDVVLNGLFVDVNHFLDLYDNLKLADISLAEVDNVKAKIGEARMKFDAVLETPSNKYLKKNFIDSLDGLINDVDELYIVSEKVKDFLSDNNCSLNPTTFRVFDSTLYSAEVKGYQISKKVMGHNNSLLSFVSFEDRKVRHTPEFMFPPYLINYGVREDELLPLDEVKNAGYTEVEFMYANLDYLDARTDAIKGVFKEFFRQGILGEYVIDPKTVQYSYYEKFNWFKAPTDKIYEVEVNDAGSVKLENRTMEPVFRSQNNNKIPETALDNFYPISEKAFEKIPVNSVLLRYNYIKNNLKEGYIKLGITPVSSSGSHAESESTNLLWLIGLPITKDLYYHYDVSMEGEYLPKYETGVPPSAEVNYLRDLTTVYNLSDKPVVVDKIKKLRKDSGKITVYKDKDYGKYIELSDNPSDTVKVKGFRSVLPKPEKFDNTMTMFLVLDIKDAESGTVIKKTDESTLFLNHRAYQLDYDKSSQTFTFWGGKNFYKNKNSVTINVAGKEKLILVLSVEKKLALNLLSKYYWERNNAISIDGSYFNEELHDGYTFASEKSLNMSESDRDDAQVEIGGAKGMKLYEIITYDNSIRKDSPDSVSDIYEYLKKKHKI